GLTEIEPAVTAQLSAGLARGQALKALFLPAAVPRTAIVGIIVAVITGFARARIDQAVAAQAGARRTGDQAFPARLERALGGAAVVGIEVVIIAGFAGIKLAVAAVQYAGLTGHGARISAVYRETVRRAAAVGEGIAV